MAGDVSLVAMFFYWRLCVSIVSLNMSAGRPAASLRHLSKPLFCSDSVTWVSFFWPPCYREWGFVHKLRLFLPHKHQIGDFLLKRREMEVAPQRTQKLWVVKLGWTGSYYYYRKLVLVEHLAVLIIFVDTGFAANPPPPLVQVSYHLHFLQDPFP